MVKSNHQKIETALITGEHQPFLEASKDFSNDEEVKQSVKRLPIRIVFGEGFEAKERSRIIQPSLNLKGSDGKSHTLATALSTVFPSIDLSAKSPITVTVQGIEPPLSTPLQWLNKNMCHADQFLYLCISKEVKEGKTN